MAAKSEVETANSSAIQSITILDSDDEEEQTTDELFQGFIKAVRPFLDRKELLLLRVKYEALGPAFKCSSRFKDTLRRKTNQVHKVDVYIHFNEVLEDLISNAAVYGKKGLQNEEKKDLAPKTTSASQTTGQKRSSDSNGAVAGKFENAEGGPPKKQISLRKSNDSIDSEVQIIDGDSNLSQSGSNSSEFKNPKNPVLTKEKQKEKERRKLKRKKLIAKLEAKLKYTSEEIKRLSQAELSLEEMELGDSSYIMENRLKTRFNQIWNKICKLKGRPTNTGRVIERTIKCKATGFPAIDKAVAKFLKRRKGFPDIFDIRNLIIKVNKKRNLGLSPGVQSDIAADVLTDIGNKLQKKRKKDYEYNFGCHLTDSYLPSLDPALNDYLLRQKLEENKKKSQKALDNVFEEYVHLGRIKRHTGKHSSSSNSSETDSESDGESCYRSRKLKSDTVDDSRSKKERNLTSTSLRKSPDTNGINSTSTTTLSSLMNTGEKKSLKINTNGIAGTNVTSMPTESISTCAKKTLTVVVNDIAGTSATTTFTVSKKNEPINLDSSQDMSIDEKDEDEMTLDNIPSKSEIETENLQINTTATNCAESSSEVKAIKPQVNGSGHDDVVEIIDNDQGSDEKHDIIMKEIESKPDSNPHKKKSPINPKKLLSKIQELRDNKLANFALRNKPSVVSFASENHGRTESYHSKRKATSVRHITHNQHQQELSLSNSSGDRGVFDYTTENPGRNSKIQKTEEISTNSQKSVEIPASSSHIPFCPQPKEISNLTNRPSTSKNNSILQNNKQNEIQKHRVNLEQRDSPSPEFPVESRKISTSLSKFPSTKKGNLQKEKEVNTIIISDDDDDDDDDD